MFLVFGCALGFGQVQPDPRVLVKQAGAVADDLLQWDGTKWTPGRADVAVVADSAAFRAFNVAIAPKLIVMTDSLRGGKFRRCYSCTADQYMTFSDALSRKWERFDYDFVTPEMFGSRGGTSQDSLPLTRALNWPKKDVIFNRPYYSSATLTLTQSKTIYGNHATLKLKTVLSSSTPNFIIKASDVRVVDLTIKGLIATQSGEWSAGIQVGGPSDPVNNIVLENLNIRDTRGDGVYIASTSLKRGNVNIINVQANNCMRNGITITAGDNLHVDGFTADSVSLLGIDLEPDVITQVGRNVLMENIHVPSIAFGTHEDTANVNITVKNFIIDNGKRGSSVSYVDGSIAHKIGISLRGVRNAKFINGTIKNTKLQGIFFSNNDDQPCKDISFENVYMVDNYTTGTDMWVATEETIERVSFTNCEFNGAATYPYFSNVDAKWDNCKFTGFGTIVVNFGGVFDNCTVNIASRLCYVPATPLTVRNCTVTATEIVVPDGANPPLTGELLNNTLTLSSSLIGGTVKHNIVTRDNLINGKYYDLVSDGMTIRQTWLVKKTTGAMGITLPKWLGANKDFILVDSVRNGVTTITGDFVGASSFATDGYSSYRFTYSGNVWHPEIASLNTPLSTIRQEGATTGQAITWNGSAWAAGNPTASLTLTNKQIGFGNASNVLVGSSKLQYEDSDAAILLGDGSNVGYKFQMKRTSSATTTGEEISLYSNNSPTLQRILGGFSNGELSGTSYAEANPAIDVFIPAARYRMFGRVNVAASTTFNSSNVLPILTMMTNTGYAGIGLGYGVDPSTHFHIVGNLRVTGTIKDSNNEDGTSGQILSTTGTGTDWVNASDNNGIYSGSGTVPNNTTATLTDDFTISGNDATGTQSAKFRVVATGTDPGVQTWRVGADSVEMVFLSGEPTLRAAGTSGNDFWITGGANDLRLNGLSVQTHAVKNVLGGYLAVPYVSTSANLTVSEGTAEVDVVGTTGTITLTFDNTSNLFGSAAKTITLRNRGAFSVTLSRGSQSWEWSDMTGTNTASNQTLGAGETAKMLWVDAGATDYYVLHKIPATFTGSPANLAISGTSSPLTVTNSNGTGFTVTAGSNITLTGTSGNITISSTAGGETVISPSSLSTDQNNWNPTDLSTATIIRMTSSVNLLMITGITAPAAAKKLVLVNIGSNTFILTAQDVNSSAANRFQMTSDFPLYPGTSVTILYDLTSAVWRILEQDRDTKSQRGREFGVEWVTMGSTAPHGCSLFTSNTSVGNPSATLNAGQDLSPGASSYSYALIGAPSSPTVMPFFVSSSSRTSSVHDFTITTPSSLSNATDNYSLSFGIFNDQIASEPDGVYLFYNHSVNSGKWLGYTNGNSTSTIDTGVTVAASTTYQLRVIIRPDGSVAYFIDDVYVGKTTTNIPAGQGMFGGARINKLAGTSRTVVYRYINARQFR